MPSLSGSVNSIIFRNEQNGYTVLELASADDLTVVCGSFAMLSEGDQIEVDGQWRQHKEYGLQFSATGYKLLRPEKLSDIEEYLASGVIRGVGPSTARAIVDVFGEESLNIMELAPNRLREVPGIGKSKAQQIATSYAEVAAARESTMFLQGLGLSNAMCAKIIKHYGLGARQRILTNPYALIDDIQGIGFRTADGIAQGIGIKENDAYRISGGLRHVLSEAAGDGHVYLPLAELLHRSEALLKVDINEIESVLQDAGMQRRFVLQVLGDLTAVYLPGLFRAEQQSANRLAMLCANQVEPLYKEGEIQQIQDEIGIALAPAQQEAVQLALCSGVCVITGGPGTGKTTIIRCILNLLFRHGQKVALAAPTGRAAKRMTEATGAEAKTIHRLLEYAPEKGFLHDEDDPLEADICIVDEASMIDIYLMQSLLCALKTGCRLILVGDVDQLPSVGPGNVLRDIIGSQRIPLVRLVNIFRQDEGSRIVLNAHRINNGEIPLLDNKSKDFFFESHATETETSLATLALCMHRLPTYFGVDAMRDIQVLCPQKKGECGVHRLNVMLQQALNPPAEDKREHLSGDQVLRVGDKVMQVRNNYDIAWRRLNERSVVEEGKGIFNGDIGFISAIEKQRIAVLFEDGKEALYEYTMLDDLMLAYAISVHKSQGCEFPIVIMPLFSGPPMLYVRNLLYTGVTRARRAVMLLGKKETVLRMVANNVISNRYSNLCGMLAQHPLLNDNETETS